MKEFVHGDFGRTCPSLGTILNTNADILELDVEVRYFALTIYFLEKFNKILSISSNYYVTVFIRNIVCKER